MDTIQPPMRPLWRYGAFKGSPDQEFGRVTDAAMDDNGNAYFLDAAADRIRVFDRSGNILPTLARAGSGPGELLDPRTMLHDGKGSLYVVDHVHGILVFDTDVAEPRFDRVVRLPLQATDMCIWRDGFLVYGLHDGKTIHRVDDSGNLLASFGDLFGPDGHVVQNIISMEGRLACFPGAGIVAVASRLLPEVRAYRMPDMEPIWSMALPGFTQVVIDIAPRGRPAGWYTMEQPPGGASQISVLRALPGDMLLVQSRRAPTDAPTESVATCVLNIQNGRCIRRSERFPLLPVIKSGVALALYESLFSEVEFLEWSSWPL